MTKLQLPDGRVVTMSEWQQAPMYSTIELETPMQALARMSAEAVRRQKHPPGKPGFPKSAPDVRTPWRKNR